MKQRNIVLIGMPGCGKSTLGVVLAKMLCMDFVDVDLVIQKKIGMPLQKYIDRFGVEAFLEAEADVIEALTAENAIIATGGSAPLLPRSAARLCALGQVVWLDLPFAEIEKRVTNLSSRGVAMKPGQTLLDVYNYRRPFYTAIADRTVTPECNDIAATAAMLAEILQKEEI